MSLLNLVNHGSGRFSLEGDLTFITISAQLNSLLTFLTSSPHIIIDFTRVVSVDSAGLALLIEWKKQTRTDKTQLTLQNIPEQLLMLAKLSGIDLPSYFTIQLA